MSKMSFLKKLGIFFQVSNNSKLYLVVLLLLLILGYFLVTTNSKTKKRNQILYLISSTFMIVFLFLAYHKPLAKIFDYMMNNLFIVIYFPNLAIYFAAIIITNIIVWISIFNFKTTDIIKKINVCIYVIMSYLLVLICNIIITNKLDIFDQASIYGNKEATALIELSSIIFIVWVIFLVVYKIILKYLKKEYKPKVKKVIVRKPIKKLPENFENIEVPYYIHTNKNTYNKYKAQPIHKENIIEKNYDDVFTLDEYKVLLKMLKDSKEKNKIGVDESDYNDNFVDEANLSELDRLFKSVK